jgi:hypothetical protein
MPKITISYRREDSGVIVGRIFDRLVAHYGTDTVFRDIDNIPPGIDYRKHINEALSSTDILLVIVGPDWAGKTPDGSTRIADPTDLVRIEVEVALKKDVPVVPVLVANATMPRPSELPDALQDFAYRNAIKVDAFEDFDDHLRRLVRSLDRLLQSTRARPPSGEIQKGAKQKRDKAVGNATALMDEPQVESKADPLPSERPKTAAKSVPWWVIGGGVVALGVIAVVARLPVRLPPAPAARSQLAPPITRPAPTATSQDAFAMHPPRGVNGLGSEQDFSITLPPAPLVTPPAPADTSQDAFAMNLRRGSFLNGLGSEQDFSITLPPAPLVTPPALADTSQDALAMFDTLTMFRLGLSYEIGLGVAQDYAKAREWYEKAAAKGNTFAMFALGNHYANGLGVAQDYGKAREWYEKAAAKGDTVAKEQLKMLGTH